LQAIFTHMSSGTRRRLPIGAELIGGGTHFRVWAPKRMRVDVVIDDRAFALTAEAGGYHSGLVHSAVEGSRYRFRLDGGESFPDPASRCQPDGPHGASQVVDPSTFRWTDGDWHGIGAKRQVFYEIHIGTFTPEGTFAAAAEELAELAGLGVTALEVMPLAEFPGRFGWGYDGVDLFAPYHGYGTPDDFRAFVNRAHEECLGVVLDVVYNHFGPDGNYLRQFSDAYFTPKHVTDWGDAINYDGESSGPVRELALSNARHWISEYHLDGLRLDATDNIYDSSHPNLIEEIGIVAREAAGGSQREIILIGENEAQRAQLFRDRDKGGFGLDMLWNDDFHHTALVAATGKREAYFTDYTGSAQELVSAVKHGFLYQGQRYSWQKQRRGTAAWDIPSHRFVHFIENHDQVANSRDGRRLHELTSPGRHRALTAVTLLGPQTPLLFQGQEFGSSAPFLYFADHNAELAKLVRKGRAEFLAQFPSMADRKTVASLPDPGDLKSFEQSRLDLEERHHEGHRQAYALHRDLIALRQCDPVLSSGEARVDGAVLAADAFVVRFFSGDADRLLVVNLGADLSLSIAPEPLLAPLDRARGWRRLWHSEDPCYGGRGAPHLESETGSWRIPAESATLLAADEE
jgi:maltooligosyltrehalose trehalohydrolase